MGGAPDLTSSARYAIRRTMTTMTNAERQKQFRQRRAAAKAAARNAPAAVPPVTPQPAPPVTPAALDAEMDRYIFADAPTPQPAQVAPPEALAPAPATTTQDTQQHGEDAAPAAVAGIVETQAASVTAETEEGFEVVKVGSMGGKGGNARKESGESNGQAEAVTVGGVTRGGGEGLPPVELSPATPARARLQNGRFPAHPSACKLATQAKYDEACARYIRGDLVRDIVCDLGLSTWGEITTRGDLLENREHWQEVLRLRQVCNAAAVEDAGLEVLQAATGQEWESREEGNTPQGPHSRTIRRRSAALLDSAAGKLMPAIHGRQAGREAGGGVNVAVQVQVAAFPGVSLPVSNG